MQGGPGGSGTAYMQSLKDDDPLVRQGSARALGESLDKSAGPALADVLGGDGEESVRLAALGALVAIGDRSFLAYYVRAIKDRSELVRRSAAEAMSGLWDETAHSALMGALNTDPSPKVRRSAALALGNPGILGKYSAHGWNRTADTEDALSDALRADESYEVRAMAASQLGRFEGPKSLAALMDALEHDKNSSVRAAAAESLGMRGDKQAVDKLISALYFEKDETALVAAMKALKFTGDARMGEPLVEALRSGSPKVRWQAIDTIESVRPDSAVRMLQDIAADKYESDGVRAKAEEALQLMGVY